MQDISEPVHPGTILLDQVMTPLGISRNQLARDIDVPVGRISDITNGKRGITADTALRLARYFGTAAELWLRLQTEFELQVARRTTWPGIEPRVRVLKPKPMPTPGSTVSRTPAVEPDRSPASVAPAPVPPPVPEPVVAPAPPPVAGPAAAGDDFPGLGADDLPLNPDEALRAILSGEEANLPPLDAVEDPLPPDLEGDPWEAAESAEELVIPPLPSEDPDWSR